MKIAILGNGSIGCMLGLKISNSGHSVTLFGDKNRDKSASLAAGAMLNVMAEVEEGQLDFEPLKQKFELVYNSQRKWDNFISKNFKSSEKKEFKKRYTVVFRNKSTTPYEKKQFDYLKKIQKNFSKDIKLNKFSKTNEIILPREKYLDSRLLLSTLDKLLQNNNVKIVNGATNYKLKKEMQKIEINYQNKKEKFDYVIIALGSFTEQFNQINRSLVGKIPKIFHGVGTAFSIIKKPFTKNFKQTNHVLRTMNRGAACGFHLIPLSKNELYFGASNAITQIKEEYSRVGSVAVLTNGLINEFDNDLKDNHIELRLGYRPTSADSFPILGPLDDHPQIIYATGNKRDGLTSSLEVSDLVDKYINGDKFIFEKYKLFKPNRNLISYYNRDIAIQKTAETVIAGRIMHEGKKFIENWDELVKKEKNQITKIYNKAKIKNFGVHPELISMYKNNRI